MKRSTLQIIVAIALVLGAALWWRAAKRAGPGSLPLADGRPGTDAAMKTARGIPGSGANRNPPTGLSAAEKSARVEQIKRDYDDIRAKASADFAAAGPNFPGGLNAFLHQLALLEREKRDDLARILDGPELEDLEMRESGAGQLVQRLLADTPATDQQRREVFRLQRDFADQFALTFDLTPAALFARESARVATQGKIEAVLGDALFGAWLRGEGSEFSQISAFAARQGLPADAALNLWKAKNDLTLRRLELAARPDLSREQQRAVQALLLREAESRVVAILGPGAMEAAKQEVAGWLPVK